MTHSCHATMACRTQTGPMIVTGVHQKFRKLRLGQHVHASDGPFGELADIVVDPIGLTVTHLVVEPKNQHRQARLVPIGLTDSEKGVLRIHLTKSLVRDLPMVSFTDFVKVGQQLDLGPEWDVGNERIVSLAYTDIPLEYGLTEDRVRVVYDRIPKNECEIRRLSTVTASDGKTVGHVEGLLAAGEALSAVIVRSGIASLRRQKAVPMSLVNRVLNDRVELKIDRRSFTRLQGVDDPSEWNRSRWGVAHLKNRVLDAAESASHQAQHLRSRHRRKAKSG